MPSIPLLVDKVLKVQIALPSLFQNCSSLNFPLEKQTVIYSVNVIAPMSTDELRQKLDQVNFVTVTIDTSNRKEVKLVPIVVRYFLPETGVKVKLLQFKSVPGKTAAILIEYLLSVLDRTALNEKLIGFCAGNF